MAGALPGLGAASIGIVATVIVADRIMRERPVGTQAKLRFSAWAATLAAGVTIEAALFGGLGTLAWLGAGIAMGGLARMTLSRNRQGISESRIA